MSAAPPSALHAGRGRGAQEGRGGAGHGIAAPRGLGASPSSRGGRFTTMFPYVRRCDPGDAAFDALLEQLRGTTQLPDAHDNSAIPAGYTYLGQFIDHDITFDATSKIDRDNDPHALSNFRTPRFDLDSLYGTGPADQPFLYDWEGGSPRGVKLLIGHNLPDPRHGPDDQPASVDLPRNQQGRATIGDARNDEHLIISQLHLLFIKFHNRVIDYLHREDRGLGANELFDAAHRFVRWHYQWIVTHDFLKRIVGTALWESLRPRIEPSGEAIAPSFGWCHEPSIPVEFSGAAYRFGHSMVRPGYQLNASHSASIMPLRGQGNDPHLGGFRRLPKSLEIEWPRFYGPSDSGDMQPSRNIDHRLAPPLYALPPDRAALAQLNLQRGRALRLPTGSDVARALGEEPLSDDELLQAEFWPGDHRKREREAILRSPPLWFYVLREADTRCKPPDLQGSHLGPVAGRIVAEVLIGLLEADPSSYLHHRPAWTPELGQAGDFTMQDLVEFALRPFPDLQ
jgi:hypothetical protein